MNDSKAPQEKPRLRSPDFRYIPCDAINMAISDNGVKLILGVEEIEGAHLELIGVHLSHKTAMFLKAALTRGLEHYQKEMGVNLEEPDLGPPSEQHS